jgi:hypothetical protein
MSIAICIVEIPSTWTVPRIHTTYLIDVLASTKLLITQDGNVSPLSTHVRAEVRDIEPALSYYLTHQFHETTNPSGDPPEM